MSRQQSAPGSPGALQRIEQRYPITWSELSLGEVRLRLPELADPVAYLRERLKDPGGSDLPYWNKLWPAALGLAGMIASNPAMVRGRVIELGAGMGVVGLVAAAVGHEVVITDVEPDALEFARAAAEANDLAARVQVRSLDWLNPPESLGRFETLLGAEILYSRSTYPALARLIEQLLAPGGVAYLSHERRPFEISFFAIASESFRIGRKVIPMQGASAEAVDVFIYRLIPLMNTRTP